MKKEKKVKLWLIIILIANIVVAIIKMIIGYLTKSTSVIADSYHSLSDGTSNVIGLIGIHFSSKENDECHPYGHGKYEVLACLFIAAMLFITSLNIIKNSILKLINPVVLDISTISILIFISTLIINIIVAITEYKKGVKLDSKILITDSMHTRSDIFISLGIVISLILIKLGLPSFIDQIVSIIVSFVIMYTAYEIYRDNSKIILDSAALNKEDIKEVILSFKEIDDVDNIRSRNNINEINIDLDIRVDNKLSTAETHNLVHNIEKELKNKLDTSIRLVAHIEPCEKNNELIE